MKNSNGNNTFDYDYLVIGGGSGGVSSAKRAAQLYGKNVAIVEGNRWGGTVRSVVYSTVLLDGVCENGFSCSLFCEWITTVHIGRLVRLVMYLMRFDGETLRFIKSWIDPSFILYHLLYSINVTHSLTQLASTSTNATVRQCGLCSEKNNVHGSNHVGSIESRCQNVCL
jgi:phytoene dehydrogenase-like protein